MYPSAKFSFCQQMLPAQKFDEKNFLNFSLLFCQKKQANFEAIVDCVCRILELRSIGIQNAEISYFSKMKKI